MGMDPFSCTENESCITKSLGTRPSALRAPNSVTSECTLMYVMG
jgi:hypothetical protein